MANVWMGMGTSYFHRSMVLCTGYAQCVLHNFSRLNKHECACASREEFRRTLCTSLFRLKMLPASLLLGSQKSLSSAFCFFCRWFQQTEGRSACVSRAPSPFLTAWPPREAWDFSSPSLNTVLGLSLLKPYLLLPSLSPYNGDSICFCISNISSCLSHCPSSSP